MTYEQLDLVADSYTPILIILYLGLWIKDACSLNLKTALPSLGGTLFSVIVVYSFMFVDNITKAWLVFGLDYSTHTALALVFVIGLAIRSRTWLKAALLSIMLYCTLMWFQKYHSVADMLSTAAVVFPFFYLFQVRSNKR